jgi:hypothetical protein
MDIAARTRFRNVMEHVAPSFRDHPVDQPEAQKKKDNGENIENHIKAPSEKLRARRRQTRPQQGGLSQCKHPRRSTPAGVARRLKLGSAIVSNYQWKAAQLVPPQGNVGRNWRYFQQRVHQLAWRQMSLFQSVVFGNRLRAAPRRHRGRASLRGDR